MSDPSTDDRTWGGLFERAGGHDVALEEVREALARHRDAAEGE